MMSASTRTIQQSTGLGSILAPLAVAGAALIATVGIAWGALNLTAAHPAAQSTQSVIRPPVVIDLGSRDVAQPGTAPVFVDHGGRFDKVTTYRRLQPK
jgi:hypothetical protein